MSYCRWSSDNWKSDVYVYESAAGIEIYVAGMRYQGDAPEGDYFDPEHRAKLTTWLRDTKRESIGGRSDAKAYVADHEEAIEILDRLRQEGYHVPQYAIDAIREEMEDV